MNPQDEADRLAEQVHRIGFAVAVRREQEQEAMRQAAIRTMLWRVALIWFAIGAVLFSGGVFVGWLACRHQPAGGWLLIYRPR